MHTLLARQLRRHLPDPGPALAAFLAAVDAAYVEADHDRRLLEHSLHVTEVEMHERYLRLQRDAEQLRQANTARDSFFQMSSDLLCIAGLDGAIRHANPSWTRQLGYAPGALIGVTLASLMHPDDADGVALAGSSALSAAAPLTGEGRVKTASGAFCDVTWSTACDSAGGTVFFSARDITELKVRASRATQAQKLQAVGQLAAGVAHEINTPIQYLGDNTEFLRQSFKELLPMLARLADSKDPAMASLAAETDLAWMLDEVPKALTETIEGVARVAELVRALKHFAHPDAKQKGPVDLNDAVTCALTVARNEVKDVADVALTLGEVPKVTGHAGSLNQVFLNLVVNAAHAVADAGRADRGQIAISSEVDGHDVVVRIRDSGVGIPDAIAHRIFEPYFTTKAVGRGSGQGLALVRSIVAEHAGSIGFDSVPGEGTTFWVRLPVAAEGVAA